MGIEARISSKGQTTIPVEIRERLGLQTGDKIAFVETENGVLIIPRNRPVDVLFGTLADYAIPDTTIDQYESAVGEGISDHVEGPVPERNGSTS
jgi:antitoxin PrlF